VRFLQAELILRALLQGEAALKGVMNVDFDHPFQA
jgi:hypothetical protein